MVWRVGDVAVGGAWLSAVLRDDWVGAESARAWRVGFPGAFWGCGLGCCWLAGWLRCVCSCGGRSLGGGGLGGAVEGDPEGVAGIHHAHPPGGLVAAAFRHYTSRAGTPLLHVHLLVSVKCRRPDGAWGSAHTPVFFENTVAWSALFNELAMAEVCQALGLATEPRTVTQGRRPVMELAGIPHELIHWMTVRGRDIDQRRTELEREHLAIATAAAPEADDGTTPCRPAVVTEATRTALNRIAARQTRPPKPPQAQPLHRLRARWRADAVRRFGVAVVDGLLARARAAAAVIRARLHDEWWTSRQRPRTSPGSWR